MVDRRRGWVELGFLALLLMGLSACGVAGETPVDVPDIAVDDGFDFGPTVRSSPNVTMATNGKATCTWIGDGNVYAERYIPGLGWVPSQQISDDVGTAQDPQAATDQEGNAVVIWEEDGVIMGAGFEVGTGWQDPVVIGDPLNPTGRRPQVAMNDSGDAVVVWEQDGGVVARPIDGDTGLQPPVALDPTPANASEPHVDIAPTGDAIVVWERGDGSVVARRYDDSEAQWDPAQDLGAGSNPDVGMDDQGNGVVAFDDQGEVLVSEYVADVAWTPPAAVPLPAGTPAGQAHTPHVAVAPGGSGLISFCVGPPQAGEVFVAQTSPGQAVTEAVSVAPAVPSCGPPMAALDPEGNALVIFQDTHEVVQAVPYDDPTGTWEDPIVVGGGRDPSVADNGTGDAVTVYVSDRGIGGMVFDGLDAVPAATIGVAVAGSGVVQSDPAALFCNGGYCEQAFVQGLRVTLIAAPLPGHRFSHWVGVDGDPAHPVAELLVTSDVALEAHFVPDVP